MIRKRNYENNPIYSCIKKNKVPPPALLIPQ